MSFICKMLRQSLFDGWNRDNLLRHVLSDTRIKMASVIQNLSERRILITGIDGFIGCNLAVIAQKAGAHIVGITLHGIGDQGKRGIASLGGQEIPVHEVQCLDTASLVPILEESRPDIIFHLAGVTERQHTPEAWVRCCEGNTMLTASILAALGRLSEDDRPVMVMPGSQMEYGLAPMPWTEHGTAMPTNPYGAAKLAATELVQAAARSGMVRACIVRLALVFGLYQKPTMIVPEIIVKALRGLDVQMTEGSQRRRFMFVQDAARLLLALATRMLDGEEVPPVINSPACEPRSILEIARLLMTLLGNPVELQVGALPGRRDTLMEAWMDSTKAESMKLVDITSLEQALAETVNWYRKNDWFVDMLSMSA